MKSASAATLAILASGQAVHADLYAITLTSGAAYYFTSFDYPITCAVYPSGSANTYLPGLVFTRGSTTQSAGLDAQEMDLHIAPAPDNPTGVAKIAGYNVAVACRLGLLDNATVLYSKLFIAPGGTVPPTTSQGAVGWFSGVVAEAELQRGYAMLKVSSNLLVLNQTQMPRNLFQATCVHTLYDAGCTLSRPTFTTTGAVSGTPNSNANFNTNLTAASGLYNLGVLTFTSGNNYVNGVGFQATVKLYANSGGNVQTMIPFPANVANGDTFTIARGCDKTQATCMTFGTSPGNIAHFKATPYVPVPETLYDGGTSNPPAVAPPAQQGGSTIGTSVGGGIIQLVG